MCDPGGGSKRERDGVAARRSGGTYVEEAEHDGLGEEQEDGEGDGGLKRGLQVLVWSVLTDPVPEAPFSNFGTQHRRKCTNQQHT